MKCWSRAAWSRYASRSGYYVSDKWRQAPREPQRSRPPSRTTRVDVSDLVFEILEAARDHDVIPLGSAFPSPMLFPWAKLARYLGSSARHLDPWSTVESLPPGSDELRRQIARRYLLFGTRVPMGEIIITSGALGSIEPVAASRNPPRRHGGNRVACVLRLPAVH